VAWTSIFARVSRMNPFPFLKHVCLLTLMVMAATAVSLQAQNAQSSKPQSPGFEKMKTLVGKWEGKLERSNGETVHLRTQYRVIGGGVSIVEDWIEDDEPMITVYHDKRGNLSAVHYCALGNAPALNMSSLDEGKIAFTFDPICGLDAKKERFVNAFHYEFNGEEPTVMHFVGVVDGVGEGKVTSKATLKKVAEWSKN